MRNSGDFLKEKHADGFARDGCGEDDEFCHHPAAVDGRVDDH